ncbi:PREDICTED: uncharacterized protein LOC108369501 [Rhagoletis zephyria]|uniref:uncharacterized protein LOC108369501 n=1 Tax=Rhagoletis zephyria TaxID=28612 RepID=UPI0008114C0D|nr:PREDICTED: uncharacterized protein LOC108369501 [Rhagoletis zephyria]
MDGETGMDDFDPEENLIFNIDAFMQKPLVAHQMFVIEIPSLIAVDTRFITPQMAMQKEILMSNSLILSPGILDSEVDTKMSPEKGLSETRCVGIMVEPATDHVSVQTDTPNPLRDRGQQTATMLNQIDVGIQCSSENDGNIDAVQSDIIPLEECNENEYHVFLEFVQKNTNSYSNSKKECLVCGEILTNSKQILSHMVTHWGPPALCEICGKQLEHTSLLLLHKCKIKSKQKFNKRIVHQQCPIYSCGLMTASKRQLNDHISDHVDLTSNRGLPCKRSFHRRYEMRRHFSEQKECSLKTRHFEKCGKKHVLVSQNVAAGQRRLCWYFRDLLRCQICLTKCLSPSLFAEHRKKCVKCFRSRLKNIRSKDPLATNGFKGN